MDTYKTVQGIAEGIYKEKGSKFLAYIHSVYNEDEIKLIVTDYKKRFYDARHHCYAWQLGVENQQFRVNDDGEPSGTAGKPIHGQIRAFGLSNVLIVVVRYFGGVKLGTGGLITAYKQAALDAIENAVIVEKTVDNFYVIKFPYLVMNDVMKIVKEESLNVVNQQFELNCALEFSIRQNQHDSIMNQFNKVDGLTIELIYSK